MTVSRCIFLVGAFFVAAAASLETWRRQVLPAYPQPEAVTKTEERTPAPPIPVITPSLPSADDADEFLDRFWETCLPVVNLPPERHPGENALALLDDCTAADFALLLKRNEQVPDQARRRIVRKVLFEYLSAVAPGLALQSVAIFPPPEADTLLWPLLAAWKAQEPASAAAWFTDFQARIPGAWSRSVALFPLPEIPPEPPPPTLAAAAEQAFTAMAARPVNTLNTGDVEPLWRWAHRSGQWEAALRKVDSFPGDGEALCHTHRFRFQAFIYEKWLEADWHGCLSWLSGHPGAGYSPSSPAGREEILAAAGHSVGSKIIGEGSSQEVASFMSLWAGLMVARPTIWEESILLAAWGSKDPAAASAWLNQQGHPPWRDAAAAELSKAVVLEEPDSAFAWAESIQDETRRKETLAACWRMWRQLEPAAADAWMDTHYPGLRETLPLQKSDLAPW